MAEPEKEAGAGAEAEAGKGAEAPAAPAEKKPAEKKGKKKKKEKKKLGPRVFKKKKPCPKCGPGAGLAEHANRFTCGKCGYTEMK